MQVENVFIVQDESSFRGDLLKVFYNKDDAYKYAYNLEYDTQDVEADENTDLYFAKITFYSGRVVMIRERIVK